MFLPLLSGSSSLRGSAPLWEPCSFITLNTLINYSINFPSSCSFVFVSPFRGLAGILPLGLLHLRPGGFRHANQSDSQVEPLLLWPPAMGHAAPGLASGVATETPPHPPRVATRDVLLHYHRYDAELRGADVTTAVL